MSNATLINKNELNKLTCNMQNFITQLVDKAEKVDNYLCVTGSVKDFSLLVDKDSRTIRRYLAELESQKYIKRVQKRGRNGGTVVVFTKDLLDFEVKENPITSDSIDAQELREKIFPSKKPPKKKYRTKEQIAEARILAKRKKDFNGTLNDKLANMSHPTWEFFENFEDPERYFKAYLISRMFNAYAVIYPKERELFYKDIDIKLSHKGYNSRMQVYGYDVLDKEFVGTPRYNLFLQLQDYISLNNIEPLSYLTVQFDYIEFLIEVGKLTGGVPFVNTLVSPDYIERYNKQEAFYRGLRARGIKTVTKTAYKGAKYPIIQALNYAYRVGKTDISKLQVLVDDLNAVGKVLHRTRVLKEYYEVIQDEISTSSMEDKKKVLLNSYLMEQVALFSRKNSLTPDQYLLAFPLQLSMVKQQGELLKLSENDYHAYMGNLYKIDNVGDYEYKKYIERGELLDFSLQGNSSFYATVRTLSDYRGIGLNIHEIREAIKEFGEEKIPLDTFGMLDITRIVEKVLTEEEMIEDNNFYM